MSAIIQPRLIRRSVPQIKRHVTRSEIVYYCYVCEWNRRSVLFCSAFVVLHPAVKWCNWIFRRAHSHSLSRSRKVWIDFLEMKIKLLLELCFKFAGRNVKGNILCVKLWGSKTLDEKINRVVFNIIWNDILLNFISY